jgi:hypothetical protein
MTVALSLIKMTAVNVAVFTMVASPLAQGAQAKAVATANVKAKLQAKASDYNYNIDKKSIQEFLKYSGLNKRKLTVGEFYSKMRPFYPKTLRGEMDQWVQMNRNEFMPEVEASTIKDSDGKERVRLLITKDGQTVTATYNPDNNAKFLKVNNVFLTKDDMKFHEQAIRKLILGDKGIKAAVLKAPRKTRLNQSVALSYGEFKRLKPRQRAEYLVRLRYVMEDAQQVMEKYQGSQAANEMRHDFFVQWLLLGGSAEAKGGKASKSIRGAVSGDPCIVSGYIAKYGNDSSCGGSGPGREALIQEMNTYGGGQCMNGSVSCNPLVYGYRENGAAICVKHGKNQEIQTSTSQSCPNQSPLRKGTPDEANDKKRIIESYLKANGTTDAEKNINLLFDKDGKLSQAQYDLIKAHLDKLNTYIDRALEFCSRPPLGDIRKIRDEQESACRALETRKMEVLTYPETPLPPIVTPEKDCSLEKPGSTLVDGVCVCAPGSVVQTITEDNVERQACVPAEAIPADDTKKECNKDEERDDQGNCVAAGACTWCKWLIGGAIFAAVGTALYFIFKDDDDDDHNPQPSVDPCPPAPLICLPPGTPTTPATPPGPPPIQPPPTDPIPPPAVTPFVESTNGNSNSTSGGVR